MFKTLVLLTTYLVTSFATTCFTQNQIQGSDILYTYKGKVYDSTGYRHPGGQNDIKKLVGYDLSEFVNSKSESFHLDSSRFYSQLDDMYIGYLQSTCPDNPTTIPSVETTTTTIPSVEITTTTIPSVETTTTTIPSVETTTTTIPSVETTMTTIPSVETTTTTIPSVETTTTTDIIPIINSSNKLVYSVFITTMSIFAIVSFN
jgi:hypothetical protein